MRLDLLPFSYSISSVSRWRQRPFPFRPLPKATADRVMKERLTRGANRNHHTQCGDYGLPHALRNLQSSFTTLRLEINITTHCKKQFRDDRIPFLDDDV